TFSIEDKPLACEVAAALLGYLKATQKTDLPHIKKISGHGKQEYLVLDRASLINLELFSTIREHDIRGSLLHTIDQTCTAMGGRMLKDWMRKPLISKQNIED